jgi:hypothetical protein
MFVQRMSPAMSVERVHRRKSQGRLQRGKESPNGHT